MPSEPFKSPYGKRAPPKASPNGLETKKQKLYDQILNGSVYYTLIIISENLDVLCAYTLFQMYKHKFTY